MEERVARALAMERGIDPDALGPGRRHVIKADGIDKIVSDHRGPLWMMYISDARVAIRAMREPTDEMIVTYNIVWPSEWYEIIDAASPPRSG